MKLFPLLDISNLPMKLGEGNVFTVVCQSFCPEGVGIWYHVLSWDGYLWYQVPSKGGYIQGVRGWVCPDGGYAQRGGYVQVYPPTYPLDKEPRGWIPTPPPELWDTVGKRVVRIPLESFLVL